MQQRLLDMGDWLKVNGEAIYDTRVWLNQPVKPMPGVFFTRKDNSLYVICTTWPQQTITVPGVKTSGKVSLLGSSLKITARANGTLTIQPPAVNPGNMPCQHSWVFKVEDFKD
jgi:alpha-L-fucosidase